MEERERGETNSSHTIMQLNDLMTFMALMLCYVLAISLFDCLLGSGIGRVIRVITIFQLDGKQGERTQSHKTTQQEQQQREQ